MDILEIQSSFEKKIAGLQYELLELHHVPYLFGNGSLAYKINGQKIRIIYHGREAKIEAYTMSQKDTDYICLFNDDCDKFFDEGLNILLSEVSQ